MINISLILILLVILFFILVYDLLYYKIPNYMVLILAGFAFLHMFFAFGAYGLLLSVLGLALGMALLIIPYALGGIAAGDVKLMGAVGAALGPVGVLIAFLYSAVAGGIYALGLMLAGRAGTAPRRLWNMTLTFLLIRKFMFEGPRHPEDTARICYGVAIAAGTIFYLVLEMTGRSQIIGF